MIQKSTAIRNRASAMIRLRTKVLVFLTHECALPVLRIFRKPQPFPYTLEELESLPRETLGHELASFIREKKLTLLVHYARHDLKHIVLGYETTDQGEVCLQSFMLGNGRVSFPVLATVGYGIITMPEYWKAMKAAYRKGRQSTPIHGWDWFKLLSEPVAELKQKIHAS